MHIICTIYIDLTNSSTVRYGTNEEQCNMEQARRMDKVKGRSMRRLTSITHLSQLSSDNSLHEEKVDSHLSTPTHTARSFGIDSPVSLPEVDDKKPSALELIDKMSVHSKRLSSAPASLPSHNDYIGKDQDEEWCNKVDPSKESWQTSDGIYSILIKNIGVFRWQNAQYVNFKLLSPNRM